MMNVPQTSSQLQQQQQQNQQQQHQQQQQSNAQGNPNNMPSPADLSLMLSLGLGLNPADASQLANLDLQKLAHYLVSNVLSVVSTNKQNIKKKTENCLFINVVLKCRLVVGFSSMIFEAP